ncbi:HEAT repeat domain-containing protein [Nonomuraea sp. NPDC005650]|uniref:HEAT repeat domain-containing protein n=1 Tax=Nonomuraea sp. NPDC005650 TaxID=3157045 RepID=UPI0033BC44A2
MELIAEAVELTRNATHGGDHDQAWQLVLKAVEEPAAVREPAFLMVRSADPAERKIGFDLAGCLAEIDESIRERVLLACLRALRTETDDDVHVGIARALACTADERALPELLRLADHPHEDVRFFVAWGLPMGREDDDAVIDTLIRLSADPEEDVRDWATFVLGTQCQADNTRIREALWARIGDEDTDAREEAAAGLARRRDHRVVPHVIRILESGAVSGSMLAAVACLGDPELLPYVELYDDDDEELVEAMRQYDPQTRASFTPNPHELAQALRECDPEARAARDAFAAGLAEALHARLPELDFGVYGEICEPGLTLSARRQTLHWSIESLCDRAGADPALAAETVAADLS